jgi:hypothetical protein
MDTSVHVLSSIQSHSVGTDIIEGHLSILWSCIFQTKGMLDKEVLLNSGHAVARM